MNSFTKHLIVVGGGAAGIFCAVNAAAFAVASAAGAAAHGTLRVTVLEKTGKLLGKVKVSGGGRCNVTHACNDITEMANRYPRGSRFVRKAFFRWAVEDTVGWFAERGVQLKTEADGRMFPVTDSSQTVIDCLMKEVNRFGVEIRMHAEVKDILAKGGDPVAASGIAEDARFRVQLADGRSLAADYVCVACGGFPKSGMFDWIRRLGHSIEEPVPSLFTFNMPGEPITRLMGVSVPDAQVRIAGSSLQERGPLLVTHWGMSGPVVLRLSAWGARELALRDYRFGIRVNWLPDQTGQQVRERLQQTRYEWASRQIGGGNPYGFPQRLWEYWLSAAGIAAGIRWADLPGRDQNKLVSLLSAGEHIVAGKTTFKEEFVTAGGVRLAEVDPVTCGSRRVAGLYFAGEILDVDGITGGYNFQHAWTSGWIVADSVVKAVQRGGM
jgi:predicted Rossmann fold flavoprotein